MTYVFHPEAEDKTDLIRQYLLKVKTANKELTKKEDL